MGRFIDLTGQKFGRLVVLKRIEDSISKNGNVRAMWLCQCDCGNLCKVSGSNLRSRHTQSCGCFHREESSNKLINLVGMRFGRLEVIEKYDKKSNDGHVQWLCQCDCGNTCVVVGRHLTSGRTISCGCYQKERASEVHTKHGKTYTRLYKVWKNMKKRCYNNLDKSYKDYGARGITVCEEWKNDFQAFHDWAMANGYDENARYGECTLDRIDVNGNYEPSNCRWATVKEQSNNRRNNHKLIVDGKGMALLDYCDKFNFNYSTIITRIHRKNCTVEQAINYYKGKYAR